MAIDYRYLTDMELAKEMLLHGSEVEKRLANYIFNLQGEINKIESEIEDLEDNRWEY